MSEPLRPPPSTYSRPNSRSNSGQFGGKDAPATAETMEGVSVVHMRNFKPLDVGFPAPGVYDKVLLVLPPLEPSFLSRFTPSGAEPLCLMLDFGRQVTAQELLDLFRQELDLLQQIHGGAASPYNRSIFLRLHLSLNRELMGNLAPVDDPLESLYDGAESRSGVLAQKPPNEP